MIRMTQQDLLPKEPDMKPYLEFEEEESSQEIEDIDPSLPQDKSSLSPSIVKEDLTVVKGVGPSVAERLTSAGIGSVKQLAHAPASILAIRDYIYTRYSLTKGRTLSSDMENLFNIHSTNLNTPNVSEFLLELAKKKITITDFLSLLDKDKTYLENHTFLFCLTSVARYN